MEREFEPNTDKVRGLIEGSLWRSVEMLHLEDEFVVIVYHVSLRDSYPVSFPVGFISAEKMSSLPSGRLLKAYVGASGLNNE